jgi:hypothetical protein
MDSNETHRLVNLASHNFFFFFKQMRQFHSIHFSRAMIIRADSTDSLQGFWELVSNICPLCRLEVTLGSAKIYFYLIKI